MAGDPTDEPDPADLPAATPAPAPAPADDERMTADLAAVLEQARMLAGPPLPYVAAGGSGVLQRQQLPIPGWSLGSWRLVDGHPAELSDEPGEDVGLVWLAETGHLMWLAVDGATAEISLVIADTPRSFSGCVCDRADVGLAVWEHLVLRLPILAACPLGFDAWSESDPRPAHAGGPALLADPMTRVLDDELARQVRRVADPRHGRADQTAFSWATDDDAYRVPGVFAATATARPYPPGAIIPPDDIKHFLFVSAAGTWLSYTSHDDTSTIREFDTVRDLYRFQIAGRPDGDVFRQMWKNVTTRHPLAREAERNPLARWLP